MDANDEAGPGVELGGDGGTSDGGLSLEERISRLEAIVGALEAEDVGLDRALELFEEGVAHVRAAEGLLREAELRVEELVGQSGATETRPFDAGAGGA